MRLHIRDHREPTDEGLLEGRTGVELITVADAGPRASTRAAWDTCLLTN